MKTSSRPAETHECQDRGGLDGRPAFAPLVDRPSGHQTRAQPPDRVRARDHSEFCIRYLETGRQGWSRREEERDGARRGGSGALEGRGERVERGDVVAVLPAEFGCSARISHVYRVRYNPSLTPAVRRTSNGQCIIHHQHHRV